MDLRSDNDPQRIQELEYRTSILHLTCLDPDRRWLSIENTREQSSLCESVGVVDISLFRGGPKDLDAHECSDNTHMEIQEGVPLYQEGSAKYKK